MSPIESHADFNATTSCSIRLNEVVILCTQKVVPRERHANGDFVAHTAMARNGAWDVQIPPKGSKSVVLKAAGAVGYFCKFHPQMGKITVSP